MFPLWLKISYLLLLLILIPIYCKHYGLANFLWLSDIGLFITGAALWFENSLLVSMVAVGIFIPELAWNVDFIYRIISRKNLLGITAYMFDRGKPLYIRGLSLFHVVLTLIVLYLLYKLGYDPRALVCQTILTWVLFLITYFFTDPNENINWIFGPGTKPQKRFHKIFYLLLIMIFFPLAIFLPMHYILKLLF